MKPSSPQVEPVSASHTVVFVSVTHNYIMPRRSCLKPLVFVITVVFLLCFLVQVNVVGPRQSQRLQSKSRISVDTKTPTEWDTSILATSITVRPPCSKSMLLLILITSAPGNSEKRAAIRETWCAKSSKAITSPGSKQKAGSTQVGYQCIFLIGKSGDSSSDSHVQYEIEMFDDILFGEYRDTYRNLSFKVLTGFQWGSVNCLANFVLKTDDDCFVNTNVFVKFLSLQERRTDIYAGHVFTSDVDTRVIREKSSKWSVPPELYAPEYYPPYVSGTGYILSKDVLHKIMNYTKHYRIFPNEDAYIGVLAEQLHIKPIDSVRFTLISTRWGVCNFLYLLVFHKVDTATQRELQATADKAAIQCSHLKFITRWG